MVSSICETYHESNKPKMDKGEAKELMDKLYDIAYDEAYKDAYENVKSSIERRKKRNELANKLYDSVEYKDVENLIRKNLPLRIRLFNKVSVIGKALIQEDTILYTYYFNASYARRFEYAPLLSELEQLIK